MNKQETERNKWGLAMMDAFGEACRKEMENWSSKEVEQAKENLKKSIDQAVEIGNQKHHIKKECPMMSKLGNRHNGKEQTMTEFEYQEKLVECLAYKKWQVVNDAVDILNNMNCNFEAVIGEMRAEKQAIIKMLDSDVSNKQKLHFIESFAEDWRPKGGEK